MRQIAGGGGMTFYVRPLDHEVLLALAWAAPLTTSQLGRLVAPWLGPRAFYYRLQRLQVQEVQVLQRHRFYQPIAGKPPLPVGWVWSLTPAACSPASTSTARAASTSSAAARSATRS